MERTQLVLTRRAGQSIEIGGTRVTVSRSGKSVRLLVEAPANVKVVRTEIADRGVNDEVEKRTCNDITSSGHALH